MNIKQRLKIDCLPVPGLAVGHWTGLNRVKPINSMERETTQIRDEVRFSLQSGMKAGGSGKWQLAAVHFIAQFIYILSETRCREFDGHDEVEVGLSRVNSRYLALTRVISG